MLRSIIAGLLVGLVIVGGNDVLEMPELREAEQHQPAHEMSILRTWNVREAVDATTPMVAPTPVPSVPEPSVVPEPIRSDQGVAAYITFYSCPPYCGDPSGPLSLDEGQAACDWSYMGRRFMLNGEEWICNDTGGLVRGNHVDLFFWDVNNGWAYLARYGTEGILTWIP